MKNLNFIVVGLAFFLSLSCSTLDVKIPVANINSPELVLKNNGQLNLAVETTKTLTTTDDASSRPPVFTEKLTNSNTINLDYNYGIADHLLIGGGVNSDFGLRLQVQYQFINSTQKNTGWSSAISAILNYDSTNRSGSQDGTFGAGGYPWSGSLTTSGSGLGLSTGYRFNENLMSYIGIGYSQFDSKTTIDQKPSDNGLNQGGSYTQKGRGQSQTVGFGFQIDFTKIHLKPVVQWTDFKYENQKEQSVLGLLTITVDNPLH